MRSTAEREERERGVRGQNLEGGRLEDEEREGEVEDGAIMDIIEFIGDGIVPSACESSPGLAVDAVVTPTRESSSGLAVDTGEPLTCEPSPGLAVDAVVPSTCEASPGLAADTGEPLTRESLPGLAVDAAVLVVCESSPRLAADVVLEAEQGPVPALPMLLMDGEGMGRGPVESDASNSAGRIEGRAGRGVARRLFGSRGLFGTVASWMGARGRTRRGGRRLVEGTKVVQPPSSLVAQDNAAAAAEPLDVMAVVCGGEESEEEEEQGEDGGRTGGAGAVMERGRLGWRKLRRGPSGGSVHVRTPPQGHPRIVHRGVWGTLAGAPRVRPAGSARARRLLRSRAPWMVQGRLTVARGGGRRWRAGPDLVSAGSHAGQMHPYLGRRSVVRGAPWSGMGPRTSGMGRDGCGCSRQNRFLAHAPVNVDFRPAHLRHVAHPACVNTTQSTRAGVVVGLTGVRLGGGLGCRRIADTCVCRGHLRGHNPHVPVTAVALNQRRSGQGSARRRGPSNKRT